MNISSYGSSRWRFILFPGGVLVWARTYREQPNEKSKASQARRTVISFKVIYIHIGRLSHHKLPTISRSKLPSTWDFQPTLPIFSSYCHHYLLPTSQSCNSCTGLVTVCRPTIGHEVHTERNDRQPAPRTICSTLDWETRENHWMFDRFHSDMFLPGRLIYFHEHDILLEKGRWLLKGVRMTKVIE